MVNKLKYELHPVDDLLRLDRLPHIWCPGCGNGIVLRFTLQAIKELESEGVVDRKKIVFISGVGCAGRSHDFVRLDGAHALHGRPIPFAVGVKLANNELMPIIFSGDGDISGIGGNHLLHAARRNFDILVIMITNFTFGMTGGQLAPTTPQGVVSTTTPFGNPEYPLDTSKFVMSLNANYVARWAIPHLTRIKDSIKEAIPKRGFRFIEVISICPEIYGRHIGCRSPFELFKWLRKITRVKMYPPPEDIKYDWYTEITCGIFTNRDKPGFIDMIRGLKK